MSATLKYRPEIDGLRAFCVLAVILFHPDVVRGLNQGVLKATIVF